MCKRYFSRSPAVLASMPVDLIDTFFIYSLETIKNTLAVKIQPEIKPNLGALLSLSTP